MIIKIENECLAVEINQLGAELFSIKSKKTDTQEELPYEVEIVTDEEIKVDQESTTSEIATVEPNQNLPDYAILNP